MWYTCFSLLAHLIIIGIIAMTFDRPVRNLFWVRVGDNSKPVLYWTGEIDVFSLGSLFTNIVYFKFHGELVSTWPVKNRETLLNPQIQQCSRCGLRRDKWKYDVQCTMYNYVTWSYVNNSLHFAKCNCYLTWRLKNSIKLDICSI